jgi:hypothetical protein
MNLFSSQQQQKMFIHEDVKPGNGGPSMNVTSHIDGNSLLNAIWTFVDPLFLFLFAGQAKTCTVELGLQCMRLCLNGVNCPFSDSVIVLSCVVVCSSLLYRDVVSACSKMSSLLSEQTEVQLICLFSCFISKLCSRQLLSEKPKRNFVQLVSHCRA